MAPCHQLPLLTWFEEGGGGDGEKGWGGVGESRLNPDTNAGSHTRRFINDIFLFN